MSDAEPCPHCGVDDYGYATAEHDVKACGTCGYDSDHGDIGVCPGGNHPNDSHGVCCIACRDRVPRDVDGFPRWRSHRRRAVASTRGQAAMFGWFIVDRIDAAVVAWLRDHQAQP